MNTEITPRIREDIESPLLVPAAKSGQWRHHFQELGITLPQVMGGADLTNPVEHPLGPPTMSGTNITVDVMLQQPTRVTAFLMDITLARFILDRLFTSNGGLRRDRGQRHVPAP